MSDLKEITSAYAKDEEGRLVEGTLKKELRLDAQWTDETFGDGHPINKMFGRNEELTLTLDEGTRLFVSAAKGRASGCQVATFRLNGIWYSMRGGEAVELLRALGEDIEPSYEDLTYNCPPPVRRGRR